ncbi:hypothetical protein BsWGS_26372 [Bradybaena similaris]
MAGARREEPSDLSQGRVQQVRKQWAVHEDGALAYHMQNEEITQHYGLNRFHRRMVREDIPVAKFVQTEEELQQQEERLKELEVLKIQAEEDAKLAKKISRRVKREDRSHRDDNKHHLAHEVRNRTDHEIRNRTAHEIRNHADYEIRNHTHNEIRSDEEHVRQPEDYPIKNRIDHDERNSPFHDVRGRKDHDVRLPTDLGRNPADLVRNPTDLIRNPADLIRNPTDLVRNPTDLVRNPTDLVRNTTDFDVRHHTDHAVRNRTHLEARKHTDQEVLDDEELARQLQEKEERKYQRHLERKREKKLKKERQLLEAALAKDLEEARLAVNPENNGDRVTASMESLHLQGVSVTRVTAGGRLEDGGDFSDFYNLPDEMDEVTRLEIQASQDEELARLLQDQEHKRTKAKVDPEKVRRIELHDEQLAKIMQEEEKLRLQKAKQRHQARKEARRLMSVESMPLGASANSLNQQNQPQDGPCDTTAGAVPVVSSNQHRYRSNSYTKACDSPPSPAHSSAHSPAHSPARRHRASPRVGEGHEHPRIPSHETIASGAGLDHKNQYYVKSSNEKQSTSSSTSSPITAQSGSGRALTTLETARQIAAGNPEGILAIQNLQKNTSDRKIKTEPERFMRSQEMLNTDRLAMHGQHRSARRGSDPYRQVTEVRPDAAVYAQPFKPHGVLLGSELQQLEVADVHGYMTDESGSSSGSASRLSRLHQLQQHQHQQQQVEKVSAQHHPFPGGSAEFNIVAALDPTYQRRHPEACLLPETTMQPHVPFSRSLPQPDGDLEWDPNLRGSLRKTKTHVYGYQDPVSGSLGHENAFGGEPVMSSWQPVQGQRRRDPGSQGKGQQRNMSAGDKRGNCKQQ